MSVGCVSKLCALSDSMTHGRLVRVQKCTIGCSHDVSSRVPARTLRTVEPGLGPLEIHDEHSGQTQRVVTLPLSAVRWITRGCPATRRKASAGSTIAIENALLVMCWQSVQWQA